MPRAGENAMNRRNRAGASNNVNSHPRTLRNRRVRPTTKLADRVTCEPRVPAKSDGIRPGGVRGLVRNAISSSTQAAEWFAHVRDFAFFGVTMTLELSTPA